MKPKKKVLIVSYYWPPSGGMGVLRTLKMAKYLRDYGWEPVVFTAKDAQYPGIDYSNEKDIPEGITVLRLPIFEPYGFYKRMTGQPMTANANNALVAPEGSTGLAHRFSVWVRSNFFIPDARAFWIGPAVSFLQKYLQQNPVDALLSDGPPHTNTMIACKLKHLTGLPWLADFQDPWTQVDYFRRLTLTTWARKRHQRLEQLALRTADKTTIVSPTWKKDLEEIGAKNVSVVPWGYDPDDYKNLNISPDKTFTLVHAGLMGQDRHPKQLFRVLKVLLAEVPLFKDYLKIRLIGQVATTIVADLKALGLMPFTELVAQTSRREALEQMGSAQILLLMLNLAPNAKGRIPGKLFEYLALQRPILCIGPDDSDAAGLIAGANAGVTFLSDDFEGMKSQLLKWFDLFQTQGYLPQQTQLTAQLTHHYLTGKIAGFLDEIAQQ